MKAFILKGIYEEKQTGDLATAEKNYLTGLKLADEFGSPVDAYKAYACLGLSRIYQKEGKTKEAHDYRKKGQNLARYKYQYRLDQPN